MVPRAVAFTIVWPEGVIFGSIMTYHVQFLLLVRQPLFDRAALPLTQTSWVLPPLSVGKMTLRLYIALNYSHGLSKGPSFGTGRRRPLAREGSPSVSSIQSQKDRWLRCRRASSRRDSHVRGQQEDTELGLRYNRSLVSALAIAGDGKAKLPEHSRSVSRPFETDEFRASSL